MVSSVSAVMSWTTSISSSALSRSHFLTSCSDARVIGLHGAVAEGLEQDVVRLAPVRLVGIGGEQAVAADRAHAPQCPTHSLVEAFFVGELVDEIVAGD